MILLYYTLIEPQPNRRAEQEAQHRAGRRLLCAALRYTQQDLEANLQYRESRKPYLPEGPFFNISHSGRLVLLAVSDEGEIGCDVEDTSRPVRNEENIRRRIARPEEEDVPLFELWVRYEAEFKAGGPGRMHYPLMPEGYVGAVCVRGECDGEIKIEQKYVEDMA